MLEAKATEFEDGVYLRLSGSIDETLDAKRLLPRLTDRLLILDTRLIRRTASVGLRLFTDWIRELEGRRNTLVYVQLGCAVVAQANAIVNLLGERSSVLSIMVPYFCATCAHEEERLVPLVAGGKTPIPVAACATCGNELELDDFPDTYLAFLRGRPTAEVPAAVERIVTAMGARS